MTDRGGYRRVCQVLTHPRRLYSRSQILAERSIIPDEAGLYAWYFKRGPAAVPRRGCHGIARKKLLYVGISPSRASSGGTIRGRIVYHLSGNVSGSTLRTSLAVLLGPELGARLRRVGSRGTIRLTHRGEVLLDDWLEQNARVCWVTHPRPWEVEPDIIRSLSLPLNLDNNQGHPFHDALKTARARAREEARRLPVVRGSRS